MPATGTGKRGGKWYMTKTGKKRYGTPPTGRKAVAMAGAPARPGVARPAPQAQKLRAAQSRKAPAKKVVQKKAASKPWTRADSDAAMAAAMKRLGPKKPGAPYDTSRGHRVEQYYREEIAKMRKSRGLPEWD